LIEIENIESRSHYSVVGSGDYIFMIGGYFMQRGAPVFTGGIEYCSVMDL
jgi:hypothetical protein